MLQGVWVFFNFQLSDKLISTLGLLLHFLNSAVPEDALQQIFALVPSVCSRYLRFSLNLLHHALLTIPEASISWPKSEAEFSTLAQNIAARHSMLQKAFGFVDGLNLPVETSGNVDMENAYYNGWTSGHYVSNVLAFGSDGTILFAAVNAPGSWHDAAVARKLYLKLLHHTPPDYYILSDTAFPRSTKDIDSRIKAPLKTGDTLPENQNDLQHLLRFSRQVVSARQAAEWGMRTLQGSFGRLKVPLSANDSKYRFILLEVCCRLHQIRTRLVGINQIAQVYVPIWHEVDVEIFESFERMLFRDIRKRDRIAQFYTHIF